MVRGGEGIGMENDHVYIAIDLKSYYASCECADRKFDPLTTNLVVADLSRTEKTICLAVSPSLKALGVPGRPRLFEVIQKVKEINAKRLREYRKSIGDWKAEFKDKSFDAEVLASDPSMELDYFVATPRMARYMEVSSKIYGIYLKYVAKEDVIVYSIDEVFIDVTKYLSTYKMTAKEMAMTMIRDVLHETGITATAGIGTNLYLASRPKVVTLSNVCTNVVSKYSLPFRFVTVSLVAIPPIRGITTKRITLTKRVLYGTITLETPSRNFTIGTKAIRMMRSFVATCTTVYAGFPFVRVLQTNTIAVQGAAPSNTAPARYCLARSSGISALKNTNRNSQAIPYIVKGLISQFVTQVIISPLGFFPICLML